MKMQAQSLEQLEKQAEKITQEQLVLLHREMLASVPRPQTYGDMSIKATTGEKIALPVTGLPLPDVDLYKGKLVKKREVDERSKRVIASFRGKNGLVMADGVYNNSKETVELIVPDNAISGIVTLSFPVWESIAGANQETIKAIMNSAGADEACIEKPSTEHPVWIPMLIRNIYIKCNRCLEDSICPNGAIQFTDDGDCYVNQAICVGQTSEIDHGRYPNERIDEQTCWQCIDHADCPTTISKVLRIGNTRICCSCCIESAQQVEGMCLPDWCEYGAIESRNSACSRCPHQELGESTRSYIVDQERCAGCLLCYNNIVCSNINMKARIHGPVIVGVITINTIRYREIRVPSSHMFDMSRNRLGFWWKTGKGSLFKEVPLEFDKEGYMHIDQEFRLEDELHIALYRNEKNGAMTPLEGGGATLRPSVKTIPIRKGVEPHSTQVRFNTRYGSFDVEYSAKTV